MAFVRHIGFLIFGFGDMFRYGPSLLQHTIFHQNRLYFTEIWPFNDFHAIFKMASGDRPPS